MLTDEHNFVNYFHVISNIVRRAILFQAVNFTLSGFFFQWLVRINQKVSVQCEKVVLEYKIADEFKNLRIYEKLNLPQSIYIILYVTTLLGMLYHIIIFFFIISVYHLFLHKG